jgi:hypothetical protein
MFVQPSSLVFLVLIGIWAAYLLQHWVRRREHLATARSVDRFSDAMRVLERRAALPELELSALPPRSYAVSPARPSRPEVVVKRSQTPAPKAPPAPTTAVRPTRIFHVLAGVSARRLRGLTLLVSLSVAVVAVSLTLFSVLPWWSVPVVVAILVADIAWLRRVALSERLDRNGVLAGGLAEPEPEIDFEFAPESESVVAAPMAAPETDVSPETVQTDVSPETVEFEIAEFETAEFETAGFETVEPSELPADADPSGWAPVPVPPPTYTLKAMAVPPVPPVPPVPVTVPAAFTDSESTQPLSLDGLVYDYDLDELVERRSATGA